MPKSFARGPRIACSRQAVSLQQLCLESDYMQPFQWCNGKSPNTVTTPAQLLYHKSDVSFVAFRSCEDMLKQQGTREQYSYNEVVLKGAGKKLSLLGQPCAVCLEEFKTRDELGVCPCSHTFHKKCLLKWLEIRSVCPMCNKPIMRIQNADAPRGAEVLQDPEEPSICTATADLENVRNQDDNVQPPLVIQ
ncbi:hypothetical protein PO909_015644 [Leuciscus waleckii]